MRDLIEFVAVSLVNHPEEVRVTELQENGVTVYQLQVASDDTGKVIGRQGRIANALRSMIKVASVRQGKRTILEIL